MGLIINNDSAKFWSFKSYKMYFQFLKLDCAIQERSLNEQTFAKLISTILYSQIVLFM